MSAAISIRQKLNACEPIQTTVLIVASTDIGTPVAFSATPIFFQEALIFGKRSARVNNTNTVYIGPSSGNDLQALDIAPGEAISLKAGQGRKLNLADWYLDVLVVPDGLVIYYD